MPLVAFHVTVGASTDGEPSTSTTSSAEWRRVLINYPHAKQSQVVGI